MENKKNSQSQSLKDSTQKNQQQSQLKKEGQNPSPDQKKEDVKKRPFRIGVIVNGTNDEDIRHYNEQLRQVNRMYREKVRLVFFGYRHEADSLKMLDGVIFEYVKPVSINHYFKQLASLKLDMLFIPLINSKFNVTSEDFNKYLEASLLKIPVLAPDIYPYNKVIKSEVNGFIYGQRENFIAYIQELFSKKLKLIRGCANNANHDVVTNFNYSADNIKILSSYFSTQH